MSDEASVGDRVQQGLDRCLDALAEWGEKVSAFVCTGEDDDVIVTHDADGRLIEMWVEPGVQQELTVEELEDAMNDALAGNISRSQEALDELFDDFLEKWSQAPYANMPAHPAGAAMGDALRRSLEGGRR
ncbi:hypothetical protein [Mycolicibacterium fallax]|uniref:Uncharacterized protein n=1 Tax=Mycolicibacterium fallax TaxID=1793 RepID=A0A1X1RMB4_MYCFA|nr:hypothetical protein [Mycolicibacterium fallax]ORV09686.1 hypothetical protein AWC04_01335 [Mycolicibacterium fallax]